MKRNGRDLVVDIAAPSTLCCVGIGDGFIKNRLELSSYHVFQAGADPELVRDIPNAEVRELLLFSDGFRLFDRGSYSPPDTGCGFQFFSAAEMTEFQSEFRAGIDLNRKHSAAEWDVWFLENGREVENWIEGLLPLGLIGEGGDILALDTLFNQAPHRGFPFVYLDFDMYAAGPFDAIDFDLGWRSLYEFWRWYGSDLQQRLESTWRYTDRSGEQFYVERVEFRSGKSGTPICRPV
jgi:hypothetical protein